MGGSWAYCWGAGVMSLLLLLLPVIRKAEPSFDVKLTRNMRAWIALPDTAPDIWYLVVVVMFKYATVPTIPTSSKAVEWDVFFADASGDFAVHEDIATYCSGFCKSRLYDGKSNNKSRLLDDVTIEWQIYLSHWLSLPALGFIENKLYRHYWAKRMGVPVPDLLYAGIDHPLAADLGLPVYDHFALAEAAAGSLDKTGFVLKPLSCESGAGVLVMDLERWIVESWTIEALIGYSDDLLLRTTDQCNAWTTKFSNSTMPPPRHGLLLHKRYVATDAASCIGTVPPYHSQYVLGFKGSCVPMEFRAWIIFGRLYGVESYTVCGSVSTPFWMYADGLGGWASCAPLSVNPVYHENCGLSVDDQRRCRTTLQRHMPEIQRWSEKIARSTGLDVVRTDWFMGGPDGLQLNEVSYGPMGLAQPVESLEEYLWSASGDPQTYLSARVPRVLRLGYAKLGLGTAKSTARILPRATMLKTLGCSETGRTDLPILCH